MAPKRRPAWRVQVQEHCVASRWHIDAQEIQVFAVDAVEARAEATRILHVRAGVAPWRPWGRYTFVRTSATPVEDAEKRVRKARARA
jgi:hypothetical protein